MNDKKRAQIRRSKKTRAKIAELYVPRLAINRTNQHTYVQLFNAEGDRVLASASTLDKASDISGSTGNIAAAEWVGKKIAERAKAVGIEKVAFDRSGFKYHGRVKAVADAARKGGLKF
ncbi:MAG: 50S ribosomal protein L18 [Gammaproteobacteria bacterium]|nr:50S ribosomal protein L18 [Gammaproteobacteria bacterium]